MEMGAGEKAQSIKPEGEIYACPACGYKDGFHVSFKITGSAQKADIYLICPNCHKRFTLGWQIKLGEN